MSGFHKLSPFKSFLMICTSISYSRIALTRIFGRSFILIPTVRTQLFRKSCCSITDSNVFRLISYTFLLVRAGVVLTVLYRRLFHGLSSNTTLLLMFLHTGIGQLLYVHVSISLCLSLCSIIFLCKCQDFQLLLYFSILCFSWISYANDW